MSLDHALRTLSSHNKLGDLTLFRKPDGRWMASHKAVGSDGWKVVVAETPEEAILGCLSPGWRKTWANHLEDWRDAYGFGDSELA